MSPKRGEALEDQKSEVDVPLKIEVNMGSDWQMSVVQVLAATQQLELVPEALVMHSLDQPVYELPMKQMVQGWSPDYTAAFIITKE